MKRNIPIPILDAGHGGMIAGRYQTPGKRYKHPDGTIIYEGEFNRAILARVKELLDLEGLPYYELVPENVDISLRERVKRANQFYDHHKNCFLLSLHANAGGGAGCEVFVSRNASKDSHWLAAEALRLFWLSFPESQHRGIKIKNFYILRWTNMPALLVENFFMDNLKECKQYLLDPAGRDRIAKYIFQLIKSYMHHAP